MHEKKKKRKTKLAVHAPSVVSVSHCLERCYRIVWCDHQTDSPWFSRGLSVGSPYPLNHTIVFGGGFFSNKKNAIFDVLHLREK